MDLPQIGPITPTDDKEREGGSRQDEKELFQQALKILNDPNAIPPDQIKQAKLYALYQQIKNAIDSYLPTVNDDYQRLRTVLENDINTIYSKDDCQKQINEHIETVLDNDLLPIIATLKEQYPGYPEIANYFYDTYVKPLEENYKKGSSFSIHIEGDFQITTSCKAPKTPSSILSSPSLSSQGQDVIASDAQKIYSWQPYQKIINYYTNTVLADFNKLKDLLLLYPTKKTQEVYNQILNYINNILPNDINTLIKLNLDVPLF